MCAVAPEAGGADLFATFIALLMYGDGAFRACLRAVEIAHVRTLFSGRKAHGHDAFGRIGNHAVEPFHQVGAVDEETAAASLRAVDVRVIEHLAVKVDDLRVSRLLRREEFEEKVVDRPALVVADENDDLHVLVQSLRIRWLPVERDAERIRAFRQPRRLLAERIPFGGHLGVAMWRVAAQRLENERPEPAGELALCA